MPLLRSLQQCFEVWAGTVAELRNRGTRGPALFDLQLVKRGEQDPRVGGQQLDVPRLAATELELQRIAAVHLNGRQRVGRGSSPDGFTRNPLPSSGTRQRSRSSGRPEPEWSFHANP